MTTATHATEESRGRSWATAVLRSPSGSRGTDLALAAVRIALAWIFVWYGAGKLFGSWNGPGLHETTLFMADTAHLHPGGLFAVLGGVLEFGGSIALLLGVGTRLVGVGLFADMLIAMITVTWSHGFNTAKVPPGYELNVALAALALVVAVLGAGRFSLDALAARRLGATRE
jgi:putative oxidoreductase